MTSRKRQRSLRLELPSAQTDNPFPLMRALEKRRTKRKWASEMLSLQDLANLCWVACGETKPATKRSKNRRTVPSGCNSQLVGLYVALDSGVYRYAEAEHELVQICDTDVRTVLGNQKMMQSAPVGLIYVADFSKRTGIIKANEGQKMFVAGTEAGLMSQNVYLYCASANLNTVLIALLDREALKIQMGLSDGEEVIYTQVVGKAPDAQG